jgi:hypothetical protein
MPRPNEATFLHQVLQGNVDAVSYCNTLFQISQTLDDLIDGDKSVPQDAVISAFWKALIELPANPFYRRHEQYLRPLMAASLQDWRDSVVLERSDSEHFKTLAFVLRDQLTMVVIQCAYLAGGESWMTQVSAQIRAHFHEDTLNDYLNALNGIAEVAE